MKKITGKKGEDPAGSSAAEMAKKDTCQALRPGRRHRMKPAAGGRRKEGRKIVAPGPARPLSTRSPGPSAGTNYSLFSAGQSP